MFFLPPRVEFPIRLRADDFAQRFLPSSKRAPLENRFESDYELADLPLPRDESHTPAASRYRYIYPRFLTAPADSFVVSPRSFAGRLSYGGETRAHSRARDEEERDEDEEVGKLLAALEREREPKKGLRSVTAAVSAERPSANRRRRRETCRGCDRVSRRAKWHAPACPLALFHIYAHTHTPTLLHTPHARLHPARHYAPPLCRLNDDESRLLFVPPSRSLRLASPRLHLVERVLLFTFSLRRSPGSPGTLYPRPPRLNLSHVATR